MDISPEPDEKQSRLSLSLVSYSSDAEDVSENEELLHTLISNQTGVSEKCVSVCSSEKDLIMSVAEQLGLSGVSHEKLDQFSIAYKKMEASQLKYQQSKMLMETIVKVAETSSSLPKHTATKISQVLDHISLQDFAVPLTDQLTSGVFGLSQDHLDEWLPCQLSSTDVKYLQEATEKGINLRHEKLLFMMKRHSEIVSRVQGPNVSNCISSEEPKSTQELLSLRKQLDHEISAYYLHLIELDNILSVLAKLKLESFDNTNTNLIDTFQSKCAFLRSQAQSFNNQIQSEIFQEDVHLKEAYSNLSKNLDLCNMEAKSRLNALQRKNLDYEKLQGTQFDNILKEYQQLKDQISHKQYALNHMH